MISIAIPTYLQQGHGPSMLRVLLSSIRSQQVDFVYEIMISDNDKTGAIKKVCDRFTDLPINYHFNPVTGASENINNAISLCTYDKVKLMCIDDKFNTVDGLKLFCQGLDSAGWVISDSVRINQAGSSMGTVKTSYVHGQFHKNTVGMPSVIAFRKSELRFDTRLKTFCDLYFYYQLFEKYGPPHVISKAVVAQRFWRGSLSHNQPPSHEADRYFLIKNGLINSNFRTVVAVIVYNRLENVKTWVESWKKANTRNAELVIIHNDHGSTEIEKYCDSEGVQCIPRENIGYDIGALQDVARKRLPGFPKDYDYLLWCTDDTIPMRKDFITPFTDALQEPGVGLSCMQLSDEVNLHVRTTGFCLRKGTLEKLTFPADPVTTHQHCYLFEHRSMKDTLLKQIKRQGLKCVQVEKDLRKSPLFDLGYWDRNEKAKADPARFDRTTEHKNVFA